MHKLLFAYKKFNKLTSDFGLVNSITLAFLNRFNRTSYHSKILQILLNENKDIVEKYKVFKVHNTTKKNRDNSKKIIWIFWWQGIETMPEIIKCCISSVYQYNNDLEIKLLNQNNYSEYVDIPQFINEKLDKGSITITHFSDILRISLLKKWGGAWLDATIFMTGKLDDIVFQTPFYSRKTDCENNYVPNGKWSAYFIAGTAENILFCMVYDLLVKYWKNHNIMIDYFLIDYVIKLGYNNIPDIRHLISDVPVNNQNIHELSKHLNDEFNEQYYLEICQDNKLHKLSWKDKKYKLNKFGKETFYNYIINNNYLDNKK